MKAHTLIPGLLALIVLLVASVFVWYWGFCRFYVDVGEMAIVTAKEGQELAPGQILAKPGQKGIWEEPLGEGRHFLNPVLFDWKIAPALTIPAGKVGVITAKGGTELPEGEFLADPGQKGIWRRVLGPGTYRLNPEGYNITLMDAVNIPIGYVGVVTSLSGEKAPEGEFAKPGQKGVRSDILQPGLYYINPNGFKIDVLEVGLNQVSLTGGEGVQMLTKSTVEVQNEAMQGLASNVIATQQARRLDYIAKKAKDAERSQPAAPSAPAAGGKPASGKPQPPASLANRSRLQEILRVQKDVQQTVAQGQSNIAQVAQVQQAIASYGLSQAVEFPSRDGFEIHLDMTVEFELSPDKLAEIYLRYGDLPAVVDKIILPQILSVSRLKGSSYRAQDFIIGEGREKFQDDLRETLAKVLAEKDITVRNSLIRHVDVPTDILTPIQQSSLAVEQNLTNIARQNTARKQAELNTAETMIEQKRQEVQQETEKLVAETKAEQEKSVAEIRANTEKSTALVAQQTAAVRAGITRTMGDAKARIIGLVEGEKAKGFELKVKAVGGAESYSLLSFSELLPSDMALRIIHAGPGTLWTDLKNAGLDDLGGARILGAPESAAPRKK